MLSNEHKEFIETFLLSLIEKKILSLTRIFCINFLSLSNQFIPEFSRLTKNCLQLMKFLNVIICFAGHPIMIVTEYMENGSLDTFLRVSPDST